MEELIKAPLLVVDASGLLYRSFYAVKGLSSPKGEPTGALYGFIRSLIKAIRDLTPKSIVVVFDGPNNKASRLKLYSEYKTHRKPTPPELITQIQEAKRFCRITGLKELDIPNVEADDTIASLVTFSLKKRDRAPIIILSADKDLMQLVQEHVFIMNPMKEYAIFDEKAVCTEWALMPSQIGDFLAIVGDSSDNVPGIHGLGPKAALQLLQTWNSLENIYKHIDEIGGKVQEKLRSGKAMGELSLQLVALDTHVDIPQEEEWYQRSDLFLDAKTGHEALLAFYREKGFKTLINSLSLTTTAQNEVQSIAQFPPCAIVLVNTEEALSSLLKWLSAQKSFVAIDTETTSLDEYSAELVGIGLASSPDEVFYIDFAHSNLDPQRVVSSLSEILQTTGTPILGHNCKYDLHVLHRYGFQLPNIVSDTLIASWLLDPEERSHSLDRLALRIFDKEKIPIESLIGKKGKGKPQGSMKEVPQELISRYCAEDVEYTLRLQDYFTKRLEESPQSANLFQTVEIPLLPILFTMEERGIFLNRETLVPLRSEVCLLLDQVENQIFEMAQEQFNLNSPKQLAEILYKKLGIPPIKKGKTTFSTDAEVLEILSKEWPIAKALLEYRQLEKLRSTYIDALPSFIRPETGRIHCRFLQSGTATGRLSCQDPNLQNIPVRSHLGKSIRAAFQPQESGWSFVAFDYSQIELRILAHMSQDPVLMDAFKNDLDVHSATAKEIFHVRLEEVTPEMRQRAKTVNFGVIYGQRAFGLSKELDISMKEANDFISAYFRRYKTVEKTVEGLKERARERGYAETLTGRIRPLPDIRSSTQAIRAAQERLAINTPFQGTAADIIKMAMIEIERRLQKSKLSAKMLLQIHDELLFEVPDSEISHLIPIVQEAMESVLVLSVPMKVEVALGKNWKEC